MREEQITAANADEQIKMLYQTAFPENEQIPWDDLMRLVEEMHLDFTAYYERDELIGFTIVYPRPSFNWYWYFAVREELRGKGLGQQILSQVIDYEITRYEMLFCLKLASNGQKAERVTFVTLSFLGASGWA